MNARTLPAYTPFSDAGLSRIEKMLAETEASGEFGRLHESITVRTTAWQNAHDDYYHDARTGREDDFATFDDEASAQALLRIRDLMLKRLNPIAFAARVQDVMTGLMNHCAVGHANTCAAQGRLFDIERNPNGSTIG